MAKFLLPFASGMGYCNRTLMEDEMTKALHPLIYAALLGAALLAGAASFDSHGRHCHADHNICHTH